MTTERLINRDHGPPTEQQEIRRPHSVGSLGRPWLCRERETADNDRREFDMAGII